VPSLEQFNELQRDSKFRENALEFFQKYTGTIEIVKNNRSETVSFPLLPYAEAFTKQQQNGAFCNMPLGKTKAKLDYFTENCIDILQTMENEYVFAKTLKHYPLVGAITKHLALWKTLEFYMVLILLTT